MLNKKTLIISQNKSSDPNIFWLKMTDMDITCNENQNVLEFSELSKQIKQSYGLGWFRGITG